MYFLLYPYNLLIGGRLITEHLKVKLTFRPVKTI